MYMDMIWLVKHKPYGLLCSIIRFNHSYGINYNRRTKRRMGQEMCGRTVQGSEIEYLILIITFFNSNNFLKINIFFNYYIHCV